MLTRNLCDLSKAARKKSKIHSLVLRTEHVLNRFGHAVSAPSSDKLLNIDHSGCALRYTEYQFSEKGGRMVGAKYCAYLVEAGRVTGAEDGGGSFHVVSVLFVI